MLTKILPFLIIISIGAASVTAQVSQTAPEESDYTSPKNPRSTTVMDRGLGIDMLPYELTRSAEKLVSVTGAEKSRYSALRKETGMKMLKMFSAPSCASEKLVINVSSDECTAAVDLIRASFYSFRFNLYGETIVDFRILEDRMIAGNGGFVHGLILDLGNQDGTVLDGTSDTVTSFFGMPIASTIDDESRQRKLLGDGIEFRGMKVASSKKLVEGGTYLVRIVSYNFKKGDRMTFNRDQVFVVKYIGMNADKVALMLWKKVGDRPAPKI